jgi:hypothetical protein
MKGVVRIEALEFPIEVYCLKMLEIVPVFKEYIGYD